jgi:hypothetical protein
MSAIDSFIEGRILIELLFLWGLHKPLLGSLAAPVTKMGVHVVFLNSRSLPLLGRCYWPESLVRVIAQSLTL